MQNNKILVFLSVACPTTHPHPYPPPHPTQPLQPRPPTPWLMQEVWHMIIITATHSTHWGQITHICISKLTIIGSDNGLSPGWHQAIIWSNAGILLVGPLVTNFSDMLIEIHTFLLKMLLKISSAKWRPFCLGLSVNDLMLMPPDLLVSCCNDISAGLILGLCPANERQHYFVMMSRIGRVQA